MNKTLLLILCDFLLLNLLALTRWEKAEPPRTQQPPVPKVASATPATKEQDLVELMKLSLEDERTTRDQINRELQNTQAALQQREQNVSELEKEKQRIASTLVATQENVRELDTKLNAATQDATQTKERLVQFQRDLDMKKAEAEKQRLELEALEKQHLEARQKIENLNVAVRVAEQEKAPLRENITEVKQQVEIERAERARVQEQAGHLAEGVGKLAVKSGELAQEIRENRPINANVLFSDFVANRVTATIRASRGSLFGTVNRVKEPRSVFITDGKQVFMVLHASDTPFPVTINDVPADWEKVSAQFSRAAVSASLSEIRYLSLDPRIIALQVDATLPARMNAKVYSIALEPFKFPEAVLISAGGAGYGEVAFKLDPRTPQYVRMDNRFFKRLLGEFTPSAGDLVFSRTGEILGIMTNSDYCVLIDNFLPAQSIKTGDNTKDQKTSEIISRQISRLQNLPFALQ